MFVKNVIKFATGKYAFGLSLGYKLAICASCVQAAGTTEQANAAMLSCASLIMLDIIWYGGIWLVKKRNFDHRQSNFIKQIYAFICLKIWRRRTAHFAAA